MRSYRNILSIVLLILALAYTLWFVFAGFGNHQDPLYWLYKYDQLEGGWMAIGSLLTGGLIVRLFGAQLLPLRLFGWLCTAAAITVPYCCLLSREQRRGNLHWLALIFVLMGYGAFQEFSPGTLSVLLLSLLWVTQSPIVLGLAVAVRFPNILALLILLPIWGKRSIRNVPIALLIAGVVYLIGYLLVTPAPIDAAMTSHAWWTMFSKLWENGGRLVGYGLLAVGLLACGRKTQTKPYISGALAGLAVAYFIACTMKPMQWYNADMTYLLSALCLVVAVVSGQRSVVSGQMLVGAGILAVATLGTDTAWLKLFPAVLCLLPVAAVHYSEHERRYLWTMLAVVSIMVAVRMTTNSVGQSNLTKVQTISSIAPYRGIAIREAEEKYMEQIKADYDSLKGEGLMVNGEGLRVRGEGLMVKGEGLRVNGEGLRVNGERKVLAVGTDLHLMRAVTGCEAGRYNEFWSNIFDSVYTSMYQPIIAEEKPIVFCFFSPQFRTKPAYQNRHSAFEEMLRAEGYEEIQRKRYTIYKLRE